jgi:hypothetical protein
MNALKIIFLFLITSCTSRVGIIYKTNKGIDFNFKDTITVKNIRQDNWSDSLVIRYGNGLKKIYSPDSIWGYKVVNEGLYRYYKGKFYLVNKRDFIIIYSQYHTVSHLGYRKSHKCYYFSKSINSGVMTLNAENLISNFKNNSGFVNFINQNFKWYKDYNHFVRVNGECKLAEIYNSYK